jgi:lipopolysaccharide transport system permease protein
MRPELISEPNRGNWTVSSRYIWHKVITELKSEVSRFYLSYFWWILEPCLLIGVFYVIFGIVFDRGGDGFVSFLILGVTAWFWFAHSVARATLSIRSQLSLMRQVYVAKYVFPFAAVLFNVFKHLFVLIVLMSLLVYLNEPSVTWLFFFLVLIVQFIFILAVSTLVAAVVPFVPDLSKVVPPLLTMGIFLSGVFYSQAVIPPKYVPYFRYNPMAGLIMEYRKVMLEYQLPDFIYLGKIALYSGILLCIGLWILNRYDRTYPRLTD